MSGDAAAMSPSLASRLGESQPRDEIAPQLCVTTHHLRTISRQCDSLLPRDFDISFAQGFTILQPPFNPPQSPCKSLQWRDTSQQYRFLSPPRKAKLHLEQGTLRQNDLRQPRYRAISPLNGSVSHPLKIISRRQLLPVMRPPSEMHRQGRTLAQFREEPARIEETLPQCLLLSELVSDSPPPSCGRVARSEKLTQCLPPKPQSAASCSSRPERRSRRWRTAGRRTGGLRRYW